MEWVWLVLLLSVAPLVASVPLSNGELSEQDDLRSQVHTRECNDVLCTLKRFINRIHHARKNGEQRREFKEKHLRTKLAQSPTSAQDPQPYTEARYQPKLRNVKDEGLSLPGTARFMNNKSGNTNLSDKTLFGRKSREALNSKTEQADHHPKPIHNHHHSDDAGSDDIENDDTGSDGTGSSDQNPPTGVFRPTRLYYVKQIAMLITTYPELEKYPIPRSSGSNSLSDKLRDLSRMTVSELVRLLHTMQHHVNPTSPSDILLHNICCDIG